MYLAAPDHRSEPLPLITVHEIGPDVPQRPVERFLPDEMMPESGLEPACDAAVISALYGARFVPGTSRGRAVPALSQIAIHFKIEERSRSF